MWLKVLKVVATYAPGVVKAILERRAKKKMEQADKATTAAVDAIIAADKIEVK